MTKNATKEDVEREAIAVGTEHGNNYVKQVMSLMTPNETKALILNAFVEVVDAELKKLTNLQGESNVNEQDSPRSGD